MGKKINSILVFLLILAVSFSGCVSYRPQKMEKTLFLSQAETKQDGNIKVSIAVPSAKDVKKIFGVSVWQKGIQPIWIQIENGETKPYVFLQRSIDPNYYSPEEAAYINHYSTVKRLILEDGLIAVILWPMLLAMPVTFISLKVANKKMDGTFQQLGVENNTIMPGETISGFVFTPLDQGTKAVNVELLGTGGKKQFTFFVKVPGMTTDYMKKKISDQYTETQMVAYNEEELVKTLKNLPCCVTDKKGKKAGDPLNLVILGELDDLLEAFAISKWDETEALGFKSGLKMSDAFLFKRNYRYSPVSPLYYEGRSQDIAIQKARSTINERLHLRLWYTPMRFNGKPVWVGTISRDIGVYFTLKTWYLTTHKIDSNIDDSRDYVLQDLAAAGRLSRFGFVEGAGVSTRSKPSRNLTGDPYFSDGFRAVLEVSDANTALSAFNWPIGSSPFKVE